MVWRKHCLWKVCAWIIFSTSTSNLTHFLSLASSSPSSPTFHFSLTTLSATVISSLLSLLSLSFHLTSTGEKKQVRVQRHPLAVWLGKSLWPFTPALFSWAAESVRWPLALNAERPHECFTGESKTEGKERENYGQKDGDNAHRIIYLLKLMVLS